MIGPGGLLLVVPHTLAVAAVLVSVLWMGLQKSKITKLGCEKYSVQGLTYGALLEMLLQMPLMRHICEG
jgi:hypothetical protein